MRQSSLLHCQRTSILRIETGGKMAHTGQLIRCYSQRVYTYIYSGRILSPSMLHSLSVCNMTHDARGNIQ